MRGLLNSNFMIVLHGVQCRCLMLRLCREICFYVTMAILLWECICSLSAFHSFMYMYACLCTCVCVCVYACECVCVYGYVTMCVYVRARARVCVCVCVWAMHLIL